MKHNKQYFLTSVLSTYRDFLRDQRQRNRVRRNYRYTTGVFAGRFLRPVGNKRLGMRERAWRLLH